MRKVYLNHDGGVDDLVSLYLLLKMEDVELVGVGVIEADCYLEPAVEASKKIIQNHVQFIRFQKSGVCMHLQLMRYQF